MLPALWWKAQLIIANAPSGSDLCSAVVCLRIPHRDEFSWLHIRNVTPVSGLQDVLDAVLALLFIPEVRGEAGTNTGRRFLFTLHLRL